MNARCNPFLALWVLFFASPLFGATNEAVRLAVVPESDESALLANVLTAQLSGNPRIHLLERAEIDRIYREQGISAADTDNVKLGRILGADGLLLLNTAKTAQPAKSPTMGGSPPINLTARLVAVRPGVILTDGSFTCRQEDTASLAESIAADINRLLPKLALDRKDAIPISVVNVRCALQTANSRELEQQLKTLVIQRLSQERQLFVLDRQRMQSLSEEKELNSDASAFWDGAYLLDGIVDRNGFSKETLTFDGQLIPPKGGASLAIGISGSRTNLAELINALAASVDQFLNVAPTPGAWSATEEAARFFDEANWALRWGIFLEAEAAADSAWALGKHDLECALARVKACVSDASANAAGYQRGEMTFSSRRDESYVRAYAKRIASEHPFGVQTIDYVSELARPAPQNIARATLALETYLGISRTLPEADASVASGKYGWKNSEWYNTGVEDLAAASQILQNFDFVPESQEGVEGKLADLRALARAVVAWIGQSPSVRASYLPEGRTATHDELCYTVGNWPNLFQCEVKWGYLWQETPEDTVALYRQLMGSAAFCYIHSGFWLRDLQAPRLTGWDDASRQRIPAVWKAFMRELDGSSNLLERLEAKALALADADTQSTLDGAFANLFEAMIQNSEALVTNNVDLLYLDWGTGGLVGAKTGGGAVTQTKDSLQHIFNSDYRPKLEAMDREYWAKTVPAGKLSRVFQQQKDYLRNNTAFDFRTFVELFRSRSYSKSQALEIQPLAAAYKSNLLAQSESASGIQKGKLIGAIAQVGFLEKDVARAQNPRSATAVSQPVASASPPLAVSKSTVVVAPTTEAPEVVTNVIGVTKFLPIPLENPERGRIISGNITAHHWFEGRLVLDFQYEVETYRVDTNGAFKGSSVATVPAVAILDPATEHWNVASGSEARFENANHFYSRTVLLNGQLFASAGGKIQKYDFPTRQWSVVGASDGNHYELFAVDGKLYAADRNTVMELSEDGNTTRILASNRRQPPAGALDTEDLGTPTVFAGPGRSLRVSAKDKIFTWTGSDWHEDGAAARASLEPQVLDDGLLYCDVSPGYGKPETISILKTGATAPELCLSQAAAASSVIRFPARPQSRPAADGSGPAPAMPVWKLPPNLLLANLPAASRDSDLYLLVDHSEAQNVVDEQQNVIVGRKFLPRDGYHAALLCCSREFGAATKLFLRFDSPDGRPPLTGADPASRPVPIFGGRPPNWMLFGGNAFFFGLENPLAIPAAGAQYRGVPTIGVWMLPSAEVDRILALQKRSHIQGQARLDAGVDQKVWAATNWNHPEAVP
jgi:hypothetical protein